MERRHFSGIMDFMEWTDALILGILQGITEFLPISSSGHLVLGEQFLGLQVEFLKSFDVVVHMGTLLAILVYFWRDVKGMFLALIKARTGDPYFKLIGYIVLGTLPAVVVGLLAEDWLDANFRNVTAVGIFMIVVGVFFALGETVYRYVHKMAPIGQRIAEKVDHLRDTVQPGGFESKEVRGLRWYKVLIIGFAQAVALLPGVSRSGSTIVAGLFQGIERSAAARFSFLLGIPAIAGAGILTFLKSGGASVGTSAGTAAYVPVEFLPMMIGFFSSFVFGLLSVSLLMRFLKTHSLAVFAVYLLAVGVLVLV